MEPQIEKDCHVMESVSSFYEARYEKLFLQIARFVSKRGGTLEDAQDLYHDTLIVYYEKLMQPDFQLQASEEAYIMGIVKNLWTKKIKDNLRNETLPEEADFTTAEPRLIDHQRLYKLVVSAGKKCLDMLSMFYVQQGTLKDLAASFGFKSEHSAAVQKYKCLEKIKETIKQNSLHYEDFFE